MNGIRGPGSIRTTGMHHISYFVSPVTAFRHPPNDEQGKPQRHGGTPQRALPFLSSSRGFVHMLFARESKRWLEACWHTALAWWICELVRRRRIDRAHRGADVRQPYGS